MKLITKHSLFAALFLLACSSAKAQMTTAFAPTTITGAVGDSFEIQLRVTKFTEVVSMQFPIVFNPAVLRYRGSKGFALPKFGASNVNLRPDHLRISWNFDDFVNNPNGITLADGTSLVTLRFAFIANGTSGLNLAPGIPGIPIEVVNKASQSVTVTYAGGGSSVTVGTGGGGGGGGVIEGFRIITGAASPAQGASFCVPVTVNDFNKIVTLQYSMNWDPTKLQFERVQGFNLKDLGSGQFAGAIPGGTASGGLLVAWDDNDATGVTVPNGTKIYEVCFKALGAAGTTADITIGFKGFPASSGTEPQAFNDKSKNAWIATSGQGSTISFQAGVVVPPSAVSSVKNVKCSGANDGSIDLTITGGATPYTYNWTGPGITDANRTIQDPTGLSAGTYNATVTAADGGTATVTNLEIAAPPAALAVSPSKTNVKCNGGSTGTINLNVTGGWPGTYTTVWSPAIPNGGVSVTSIAAGTYKATVTDVNGCSIVSQSVTVEQPSLVSVGGNPTIKDATCSGKNDGGITIVPTNGTAPYTVAWNNTMTGPAISNLAAGPYVATITDAEGCTAVTTPAITVGQPVAIAVPDANRTVKDANCGGNADGGITITPINGKAPYTINWTGGKTGPAITGLTSGAYIATISDADGCSVIIPAINVGQPAAIAVTEANRNIKNITCFGAADGSVTITPTGGRTPYRVDWTRVGSNGDGLSGTTISNLAPGKFTATITDAAGCSGTLAEIEVKSPNALVLQGTPLEIDAAKPGGVKVEIAGGTVPYTYDWSNDGPETPDNDEKDLSTSTSGTYNLTVTDVNGCQATLTDQVVQDANRLRGTFVSNVANSCNNSGSITINISPRAKLPVIVLWSGGLPNTEGTDKAETSTKTITGLRPATYSITLRDAENQQFVLDTPRVITQLPPATPGANVAQPFESQKNGSIILIPPPGSPLSYKWSNGSMAPALISLDSGTYKVTVTNVASGCTAELEYKLERLYKPIESAVNRTDLTCASSKNGAVSAVINGGLAPYTYAWRGPDNFTAATAEINNLAPGVYNLTVTDARGITKTEGPFNVSARSQLAISNINELSNYRGFQVSGAGVCDGLANVAFSGQATGAVVNVAWSNGITTAENNKLCGGAYSVTVTDDLGCSAAMSGELTAPPGISMNTEFTRRVSCYGKCDATARIRAAGGVEPYSVKWSFEPPEAQPEELLTPNAFSQRDKLCGGTYKVTITDKNNVARIFNVTVEQPDSLELSFEQVEPSAFVNCDGELSGQVKVRPGNTYLYTWNSTKAGGPRGVGQRAQGLCSGEVIQFVVTDQNGCRVTGIDTIPYPEDGCFKVGPVLTPGEEDGRNDFVFITCAEADPRTSVEIYNRWGQLVFQEKGYNNGNIRWEGKIGRGQIAPEGVYYVVINGFNERGEPFVVKTYFNLLR